MNKMNGFEEIEQILGEFGIGIELLMLILGIGMVFVLIYGVFAMVSYIFQSIGLYTIASRRGIKNPWLAWIPYGNYWIAGTISDQYRYVSKGQIRNNRIIMLCLVAVTAIGGFVIQIVSGNSVDAMLEMILSGETGGIPSGTGAMVGMNAGIAGLWGVVSNLVTAALYVFWQISLYDLYMSSNPKNAVLFLVLGILFSFLVPFFIFACRKREDGMPPRKQAPAVEVFSEEPAWQPPEEAEPWEEDAH